VQPYSQWLLLLLLDVAVATVGCWVVAVPQLKPSAAHHARLVVAAAASHNQLRASHNQLRAFHSQVVRASLAAVEQSTFLLLREVDPSTFQASTPVAKALAVDQFQLHLSVAQAYVRLV